MTYLFLKVQNVHTVTEDPKMYIMYSKSGKLRPLYHCTTRELDIFCVKRLYDEYLTSFERCSVKTTRTSRKKKKERFMEISVKLASSAKWIKWKESLTYTEKP